MNSKLITTTFAISTLGKRVNELKNLLESLGNQTITPNQIIVILQGSDSNVADRIHLLISEFPKMQIRLVLIEEFGLSSSRNQAIKHFNTDLLVISDDDLIYDRHANETIIKSYNNFPGAAALTFQMHKTECPTEQHKSYSDNQFRHTVRTAFKVSSAEIVLTKVILGEGIQFDTAFGLGSRWPTGEENILLNDIIKRGFGVYYIPNKIVYHPEISSGLILNNKLIKSKGAMFCRMFALIGPIYALAFAIKKCLTREISVLRIGYVVVGSYEFFVYLLKKRLLK